MIERLGRMRKVSVILTPEAFDEYLILTEALGEENPANMIDRSVSLTQLFVKVQKSGKVYIQQKRVWWKFWLFPGVEVLADLKDKPT